MKTFTRLILSCLCMLIFLGIGINSVGQVAITDIDGYSPNSSAVLDVKSTSKGLLVPRLTTSQLNSISSPAEGLLVFDTDNDAFFFYSTAKAGWTAIGSGTGGTSPWTTNTDGVILSDLSQKVGIGTNAPLSKLEVIGDASIGIDDPLFEVKNNAGATVFAVYREGVRMFIADGNEKGTKGGFAIGSLSGKSGESFLIVSPDSTRIYVNEAAAKGTKGGFAIGSLSPGKAGSESFLILTPENYLIGHQAGYSLTTGLYNSFMGYQSGYNTTDGSFNVFLGRGTGYSNTSGSENIFIGDLTGNYNTTGYSNVFIGDWCGASNTTGVNNIFMGSSAGWTNTTGENNVFLGTSSGLNNEIGSWNVFLGESSGYSNTEGVSNVYIGQNAGYDGDTANYNVSLGTFAGESNYGGDQNVFIGQQAGQENTEGSWNTMIGVAAGWKNTTGQQNVILGNWAGTDNTTGGWNVFLGGNSGSSNTTGIANVAVGDRAGYSNLTGEFNVFIGHQAGYNETESYKLYIDNSNTDNPLIYGDFSTDFLRFNGNVEVTGEFSYSSDKRWKKNINTLDNVLERVTKLRGVTYEWKISEFPDRKFNKGFQIGVIAQEVEEIFPELVNTDKDGYKTVEYAKLTPILIEAIKDQQSQIEDLSSLVEKLQKDNKNLNKEFEALKSNVTKLMMQSQAKMEAPSATAPTPTNQ